MKELSSNNYFFLLLFLFFLNSNAQIGEKVDIIDQDNIKCEETINIEITSEDFYCDSEVLIWITTPHISDGYEFQLVNNSTGDPIGEYQSARDYFVIIKEGEYFVNVRETGDTRRGCVYPSEVVEIRRREPVISVDVVNISCNEELGSVRVELSDVRPTYRFNLINRDTGLSVGGKTSHNDNFYTFMDLPAGNYTVEVNTTDECEESIDFEITNENLIPPVNPIVTLINNGDINGEVVICGNDNSVFSKIFLCGINDSAFIDTEIANAESIVWEKLSQRSSCVDPGTPEDDCPNPNPCMWNTVHTGNDYTADTAGEFRLQIIDDSGCSSIFYFDVYKKAVDIQIIPSDLYCRSEARIIVVTPRASEGYEFQLVDNNTGNPIGEYQSHDFLITTEEGDYFVNIKETGAAGRCVFTSEVIEVRRREPVISVDVVNISCNEELGSVRVELSDVRPTYRFNLINRDTGLSVGGKTSHNDNFYTFMDLPAGNYTVEVNTTDECEESIDFEITNENLIPPVNPIVTLINNGDINGEVVICGNDNSVFSKIFLCGINDSAFIDTEIANAESIVWEMLEPDSCEDTSFPLNSCPNLNDECTWSTVHTGKDYTADTPGEFRVTIVSENGCFRRYYFDVNIELLDIQITSDDLYCDSGVLMRVISPRISDGYEFQLVDHSTGDPIGEYQSTAQFFVIHTVGEYIINVRKTGVSGGCVFPSEVIEVIRREPVISIDVVNPTCEEQLGSASVQLSNVRPPYRFLLVNRDTGLWVDSKTSHTDSFYTFMNLSAGNYTASVITDDNCEESIDFEIIDKLPLPSVNPIVTLINNGEVNGEVLSCILDGDFPKVLLCGINDSAFLDTGITNAESIFWEILEPDSCGGINSPTSSCPNLNDECTWSTVHTGEDYTADTPGEFRVTIVSENGCFRRYYFDVNIQPLDIKITSEDLYCSSKARITIETPFATAGYEFQLVKKSTGDPIGEYQSMSQFFVIIKEGEYFVNVRETGTIGGCVYPSEVVEVRRREPIISIDVENVTCDKELGLVKVELSNVRPTYQFYLINRDTGADISKASQDDNVHTFMNLKAGNYTAVVKTSDKCKESIDFEIIKETPLLIENPIVTLINNGDVNGEVVSCNIDGADFPKVLLCGINDSVFLDTDLTNAESIVWEKLSQSWDCIDTGAIGDNCPNTSSCVWDTVHTGNDYTVDTAGEFRLQIIDDSGCPSVFYFDVYKKSVNIQITSSDLYCSSEARIIVNTRFAPAVYEFQLVDDNTGYPIGEYQPYDLFIILEEGDYFVNVRETGAIGGCVFPSEVVKVRRREPIISVDIVSPTCDEELGSVKVQLSNVRPTYYFSLINRDTGLLVSSETSHTDNFYTFMNLPAGNYTAIVDTTDGCEESIDFVLEGNNGNCEASTEKELLKGISIYPNPASYRVDIDSVDGFELYSAELISVDGYIIKRKLFEKEAAAYMDLFNISKGAYFLRLTSIEGLVTYKRILKK